MPYGILHKTEPGYETVAEAEAWMRHVRGDSPASEWRVVELVELSDAASAEARKKAADEKAALRKYELDQAVAAAVEAERARVRSILGL
jgi:hypothetical protein